MIPEIQDGYLWMVIVGFLLAFFLSLGIGANDVANTFGTSVGSKVLTLRAACIFATIMETSGAILLGAKVSDTVREGIVDTNLYQNETDVFVVGNIAALTGSSIWMVVATFFNVPVSATQSIIGAMLGFTLVAKGGAGVQWMTLVKIVASWLISPLASGLVATLTFMFCNHFILKKDDPLEPGLKFLPLFYFITVALNIISILLSGPDYLKFDVVPVWGEILIAIGVGIIVGILVRFILVPWQRNRILNELTTDISSMVEATSTKKDHQQINYASTADSTVDMRSESAMVTIRENQVNGNNRIYTISSSSARGTEISDTPTLNQIEDRPETARVFSYLQILTAVFGSFAHGGNDVANAIGPLISVWLVSTTGSVVSDKATPFWVLLYGGIGISLGLWIWGRRVIQTLGTDLSVITPSSGFSIEIGSAFTVLLASNLGIPISSTHCKVGAVVVVGRWRNKSNVDWSIFRNIVLAWVLTLPMCCGISAAMMALLTLLL